MPDKLKAEPEPTEVTVVNPEPIPVKIEITNQAAPPHGSDVTAAEIVAKAAVASEAVKADAMVAAADKVELAKIAADERKDQRDLMRAAIIGLPSIITAILTGVALIWINSLGENSGRTERKVDDVHEMVNSRLTELLEISKKSSHAEGVIEGKAIRKESK